MGGVSRKEQLQQQTKEFMQKKVLVRNSSDDEIWEKVKNVPKLSKPLAIFCAVINIILPGSGTITAACMTPDDKLSKSQLIIGIL